MIFVLADKFKMDQIVARLKRINGQISGLIKLIEAKEDCEKIIIQFQAVKGALNGAFTKLLSDRTTQCSRDRDLKKLEKILKVLVNEK